jgi:DNA mismatch repair protein MutS2
MSHALQVIEYARVVERLVSHCETPAGMAYCADLLPVFVAEEVWELLGATGEAYELLANDPPPTLSTLGDPRQSFERAAKGGELDGIEVYKCGAALGTLRRLKSYLRGKPQRQLAVYADVLPDHPNLEEAIFSAITGGGDILDSASQALASIRARRTATAQRVIERIQSYVSGRSREWLSDPIYTTRDGRYVLPVKSEYRSRIKGIVHDTSSSGATVFIEPDDVLQLGNALREVEIAEREEVRRILRAFATRLGAVGLEAIGGVEAASKVDAIFARARLAYADGGSMPQQTSGQFIALHGARHPLIERTTAVPLDLEVGQGAGLLITGPNTGGKTVAIKTVGLAVAMAQSGLFPPALDVRLGPFTGLWADIGDEQSLQQSLSTFSGHLKNIAAALAGAQPGALVLFDELGAGTDPAEGAALAIAILKRLQKTGCAVLASTHYGELKAFAYETEGFQNAAMEFNAKTLQPTYRLLMGAAGASQALRIAERYGIPADLVAEAREGLGNQAMNLSQVMEELDRAQKLARTAQGEADRRLAELRKAEADLSRKLADAEERRAQARRRGAEAIDDALREIRLEAASLFDQLKRDPSQAGFERTRKQLAELDQVGRDLASEIGPAPAAPQGATGPLAKGMSVRVEGYQQVGTLIDEPSGKSVTVQLGNIRMKVLAASLRPVEDAVADKPRPKKNLGFQRAQTASTEIHLRAQRAEQAEEQLQKFLDDAELAGLDRVRIVHGKGMGILRKVTREVLRKHHGIASFRDGEPSEGGEGVTVAVLK